MLGCDLDRARRAIGRTIGRGSMASMASMHRIGRVRVRAMDLDKVRGMGIIGGWAKVGTRGTTKDTRWVRGWLVDCLISSRTCWNSRPVKASAY
jgi:hypothetical protein